MDLSPYIAQLRRDLTATAAAGSDQARELADRLTAPLESTGRLVLLGALSAAAGEITRELAPGSVEVRLRGVDPEFVVTPRSVDGFQEIAEPIAAGDPGPLPSDAEVARISLRLPEGLKARVEEAAAREGVSVNSWLVRAAASAVSAEARPGRGTPRGPVGGQRLTGWVR